MRILKWLRGAGEELLGLFVDDWRFAGCVLAWILAVWFLRRLIGPQAAAVALAIGLAIITVWFTTSRARAARKG